MSRNQNQEGSVEQEVALPGNCVLFFTNKHCSYIILAKRVLEVLQGGVSDNFVEHAQQRNVELCHKK